MKRPVQDDNLSISTFVPVDFDLQAPPPDLADYINTFFVIRTDEEALDEMMPAYSAQLLVYIRGRSHIAAGSGEIGQVQQVTFTAPLMQAMPVKVSGPLLLVGASLTPLGWQCLANTPVDQLNNCMLPARDIMDADTTARLENLADEYGAGKIGCDPIFEAISETLRARRGAIRSDHVQFVHRTMEWLSSGLSPSIDDFYRDAAMSPRTAQRLSKRFFGVSPTRLIKRYRAIRAAMLLANPALPQPMRDEIRNSYFDQAHLIRDIRRYTGRTPTALNDGSIAHESLYPEGHGEGAKILRKPLE